MTGALPQDVDVVVLGGGAAGLFCARAAGQRGRRVLVLEANERVGKKILVSGGGRANFTNRSVGAEHYVSHNVHFARSALARFTPEQFIELVEAHGIPYHERRHGQLFCDESAKRITAMLLAECAAAGVEIATSCPVAADDIEALSAGTHGPWRFGLHTPRGNVRATSLVVATGGLSWPRLGITDIGYRIAQRFDLGLVPTRPGLVPLSWDAAGRERFGALSGIAVPARVTCGRAQFEEAVLFTHTGLSGPAVLQVSNHWQPGDTISIDWLPDEELHAAWPAAKFGGERRTPRRLLAEHLPRRFVEALLATDGDGLDGDRPLAQCAGRALTRLADRVHAFPFQPAAAAGWDKAEVTLGGVDTRELSSRTLEARRVPGLHFIGEVVDVTGWLGGFNFQWAWASGHAAGQVA